MIGAPLSGYVLELLVDGNDTVVQINTLPKQLADLSSPHPGEQCGQKRCPEGMVLNGLYEPCNFIIIQRPDFLSFRFAQFTGICRVDADISQLDSFLQSLVQNPVDVFHGLSR